MGPVIQVTTIWVSDRLSMALLVKKLHPMIAPTIACVVDTGRPALVIENTVSPAASATVKAPPGAFTDPRRPSVSVAPAPCSTAPRMTKTEAMTAARVNETILEPTADPNTFAASFAPRVHPRNSPLRINRKIMLRALALLPSMQEDQLHPVQCQRYFQYDG